MNGRLSRTSALLVTLLVGTALAVSGSVAAVDSTHDVQSPALAQDAETGASLQDSIVNVDRGETATINVSLQATDEVALRIGGDSKNYMVNATATDGNGDGTVSFQFDTSKTGSGDGAAVATAADADNLTVQNETTLDGSLAPGMYGVTLYAYNGSAWNEYDVGGLNVKGESTSSTSTTSSTTTPSTSSTTSTTSDTTTNDDGMPGFGLGVALVALAAAAMLAHRR